jgi:hypothetical protein
MRSDQEPILTAAGAHWSMLNSPAVAGASQGIEVGEEGARRPTADGHGTGSGDIPLPALTRVSICPFCPA